MLKLGLDDYLLCHTQEDFKEHLGKARHVMPFPDVHVNIGEIERPAELLAGAMRYRKEIFFRKPDMRSEEGLPVLLDDKGRMSILGAAQASSEFERVARVKKMNAEGADSKAVCPEAFARIIIASRFFRKNLLPLVIVSRCPMLKMDGTDLAVISGYDRQTGIYAMGIEPETMGLEDAVQILMEPYAEFKFATPGDKSRHFANVISPALVLSGILPYRAPIAFNEADASQTGKGKLNQMTAAIYGDEPAAINQTHGGVGGMIETFDTLLISGRLFLNFDNLTTPPGKTGVFNSEKLCSFMTEPQYSARMPHAASACINPKLHVVMATTNNCVLSIDLMNRTNPVRILHQPGKKFRDYKEGGIIEHVKANSGRLIGAVFAVCKEYVKAGKPRTDVVAHDSGFTPWFQSMDWIGRNLLGLAPMLEGYEKVKVRMTSPELTWLRELSLAVKGTDRLGRPLQARELLEICAEKGVNLPGTDEGESPDLLNHDVQQALLMKFGGRMARCFRAYPKADGKIHIDSFTISKLQHEKTYVDLGKSKSLNVYVFAESSENEVETAGTNKEPIKPPKEPMPNPQEPIEPTDYQIDYKKVSRKSNNNIVLCPSVGSVGSGGFPVGSRNQSIGSSTGSSAEAPGINVSVLMASLEEARQKVLGTTNVHL
jgi:hypothetical protein